MARHKEFDRSEVLKKAMQAFWRHGYEATSIQDLVEATGINRGSMYDTFGDKRRLFQAAIDYYIANVSAKRVSKMTETTSALEAIRTYFEELVAFSVGDGRKLGCLITNSVVELAPHDPEIAGILRNSFARVEEAFFQTLQRGQRAGEISSRIDARAVARFLTATTNGIRVFARAQADAETLLDVVNSALTVIESKNPDLPIAAE